AHPNGACFASNFPGASGACTCGYGCASDADCGPHEICDCRSPLSACVPASCKSDADCGEGLLCAAYSPNPGCFTDVAYGCQTPEAECKTDADCPGGGCAILHGHRACLPDDCEY